jgi:hypothetical protein
MSSSGLWTSLRPGARRPRRTRRRGLRAKVEAAPSDQACLSRRRLGVPGRTQRRSGPSGGGCAARGPRPPLVHEHPAPVVPQTGRAQDGALKRLAAGHNRVDIQLARREATRAQFGDRFAELCYPAVRRVAAPIAEEDGVLANPGEVYELVGHAAAYDTHVRLNGGGHSAASKYTEVRPVERTVLSVQPGFVPVEAVGVIPSGLGAGSGLPLDADRRGTSFGSGRRAGVAAGRSRLRSRPGGDDLLVNHR